MVKRSSKAPETKPSAQAGALPLCPRSVSEHFTPPLRTTSVDPARAHLSCDASSAYSLERDPAPQTNPQPSGERINPP
jgi:hypothetical protein